MTEMSWRAGKGKKWRSFKRNALDSIAKSQSEGDAVARQTEGEPPPPPTAEKTRQLFRFQLWFGSPREHQNKVIEGEQLGFCMFEAGTAQCAEAVPARGSSARQRESVTKELMRTLWYQTWLFIVGRHQQCAPWWNTQLISCLFRLLKEIFITHSTPKNKPSSIYEWFNRYMLSNEWIVINNCLVGGLLIPFEMTVINIVSFQSRPNRASEWECVSCPGQTKSERAALEEKHWMSLFVILLRQKLCLVLIKLLLPQHPR